jgi:hypothetical protein
VAGGAGGLGTPLSEFESATPSVHAAPPRICSERVERVWSVERYDAAAAEVQVTPTSRLLALPGGLLPAAGQAAAVRSGDAAATLPDARMIVLDKAHAAALQSVLLRCIWPLQSWASRCAAFQPSFACGSARSPALSLPPCALPNLLAFFLSTLCIHAPAPSWGTSRRADWWNRQTLREMLAVVIRNASQHLTTGAASYTSSPMKVPCHAL